MTKRVVFLDIDDVLLTSRAYALAENLARIERMELPTTFDPVAVAWLVRLCRLAAARVVVHSSWRGHIGTDETIAHLAGQGIEPGLFHRVPACPCTPLSTKAEDIRAWLEACGADDWVVLDDAKSLGKALLRSGVTGRGLFLHVNPAAGFGPSDYWRAMRHFGAVDPILKQPSAEGR